MSAAAAGAQRFAQVVFAVLVVACFAAFIVTQRLKHTPTAVQRFELTPVFSPSGKLEQEHISFKLATADEVTVTILDSQERAVATIVRDLPTPRYKQLSLRWNGRTGDAHGYRVLISATGHRSLLGENRGAAAAPGTYSVRISLIRQRRTIVPPRTFKLVGG